MSSQTSSTADRTALAATRSSALLQTLLAAALGAPPWVGAVSVAIVVLVNVVSGGMRSITFVQAFQYWLKVTALLVPAIVLLMVTLS